MVLQYLSTTTRGHRCGAAHHFSRCTMTALRRLACCSVLLSSDSSLLGKVVIRTKSTAAMEGRAVITKSRRSEILQDTRHTHLYPHPTLDLYLVSEYAKASDT